jgi:RimJ/RimL family protein N-acetyltransferase
MSQAPTSFALVETQRLLLRRPVKADADAVFRIHSNPATNRFNPHGPATAQRAAERLTSLLSHWSKNSFGYWSVALRSEPKDIIGFGGVGIKDIEGIESLNLYFRLSPSVWGQGFAVELGAVAIEMAFAQLSFTSVSGLARLSNTPSRKALERLGLRLVRVIEDTEGFEASALYQLQRQHAVQTS